jgi:hypothetical protein
VWRAQEFESMARRTKAVMGARQEWSKRVARRTAITRCLPGIEGGISSQMADTHEFVVDHSGAGCRR